MRTEGSNYRNIPKRATGNGQLATGNWQLATGNWQINLKPGKLL